MAYDVLFQAYSESALEDRYHFDGNTVAFELRHGEQWPGDKDRPELKDTGHEFDRIELSIKPESDPSRWLTQNCSFMYEVRAPWEEKFGGGGYIILGQLHCKAPMFSLRWTPGSETIKPKLWIDFISTKGSTTTHCREIGNILTALSNGDPLTVYLETSPKFNSTGSEVIALNVTATVYPSNRSDLAVKESVDCYPKQLTGSDNPTIRFKIGAYRRRKDASHWENLKIYYDNLSIDGAPFPPNLLISPQYNCR
ncbi:MAG: hypothetical protein JJ959_07005 [Nisaea sp.]|uniref:hypothetical protein n=1 Tax=Nisaea sp. TaxID=2024842 RepID=UPI001B0E8DF9|nr:hypothetical protein [Nisaea sp.]MBO6560268.1 hypothetical protein [Nisaea sp.]